MALSETKNIDIEKVKHLPALNIAEAVNQSLNNQNRLIITAAPGAGKSTLLPLTIMNGLENGGKFSCWSHAVSPPNR
ncbi:MAG: hypothetical protein MJZ28_05255 [Paludibacteraceae bacterium]|nr:hypothetical protein [Paludibacteraceae bacterium]